MHFKFYRNLNEKLLSSNRKPGLSQSNCVKLNRTVTHHCLPENQQINCLAVLRLHPARIGGTDYSWCISL